MDLIYDLQWFGWVLLGILGFLSLLYLNDVIRKFDASRIVKLQNVEVYVGGPAEFSIKVNKPETEVSWFVNEHEVHGGYKYDILSDGIDRKLMIKKTELSDDGATIAVVVNGTGETATCKLTVKATLQLNDRTVYEGQNAEFICEVYQDDIEVSWFVNDKEATGEQYTVSSQGLVRTLVIQDTKLTDDGAKVTVRVNDQDKSVQLAVKEIQLSGTTVYEGENAEFIFGVYQEGLKVSWLVNGVEATGQRYEISSDALIRKLMIKDTKLTDNGTKITVQVNDKEKSVQLVVKEVNLRDVTVYEGDDAEFIFEVYQESHDVSWIINDTEITGDRYEVSSDGLVRKLMIKSTKLTDDGTKVTVLVNDQNKSVQLAVNEILISDTTVYEGENAEFILEVYEESLEVSWFVNNTEVTGERYEVSSHELVRKLVIKDTKLQEDGTKITVKVGDKERSYQLKVKASNFSNQISDVIVKEGDTAVFSCEIRNVTDTVQWFVNGNTINSNDRYTESKEGTRRELKIHHSTLSENETQINVDIDGETRIARLYVGDIDENKRRWLTVGVALNTVLCPLLRNYTRKNMHTLWQRIELTQNISRQSCPPILKSYGNNNCLNYSAINGNDAKGKQFIKSNTYNPRYDYTVKTPVDFAKLFLKSHMSHLKGFDNTCDISAVLNIISGCGLSATNEANQVRKEVRNPWGHCNFKEWGLQKFKTSFSLMCDLVKKLCLSSAEENERLTELNKLENIGAYLFDGSCGITLVQELKDKFMNEVKYLVESTYDTNIKKTLQTIMNSIELRLNSLEKSMEKVEKIIYHHIPVHKQEQFNRRVTEWRTEDDMFVPTQSAEEVMIKIKEHNFVVMTGNSGTGKTFTVRHTALMMEKEGYIIVPAVKPEDISKYFRHGCKTVFVFDDLCGRFTLDDNVLSQWKSHKQSLETILKDDCCKVLASCRLQVFKENRMTSFCSEIDVNECKIRCSLNEKWLLIEQYFGNKPETITEEKLSEFDFLPFLCSNIKNKNKDISELEKCFENPFAFYSDEFKKLYIENDDGKRKCCALILCVLYNNTLTWDELSKKSNTFCSVLENCELSSSESPFRIKTVLKSLDGVYITCDNDDDGTYKIIHDKLFDFVAKYFGEKMTHLFINFSDSNFLRERFSIKGRKKSETNDCIELSDDKIIKLFMERMVRDWMKGEVNNVFGNTNMKSEQFRQELLSYLRQLDLPSQRELVHIRENKSGDTPLLKICLYGDLQFAKWILDLGADINLRNNNKSTPLNIACDEGHTNLVKVLLRYESIDVNQSDKNGWTALHMACYKGYVEIVNELIQHNVDINSTVKYNEHQVKINSKHQVYKNIEIMNICTWYRTGFTPLMLACTNNRLEVVKVLLQCVQIDVNQSDHNGITALHVACKSGNVEIVTELIKQGMDINQPEGIGLTPLMLAIQENHLEVVKELLKCEQIDVNQSANDGTTALHIACKSGNVEIVTEIIQRGIDINQKQGNGSTPLMSACMNENLEVVKVLLQCEQIDVNHSVDDSVTAFGIACFMRNIEIVQLFIEHNVDVNKVGTENRSNVTGDCQEHYTDDFKKYLESQSTDLNQGKNFQKLPNIWSCQTVHTKVVKDLAKFSTQNLKSCRNEVCFPLFVACILNHVTIVQVLLKCSNIEINRRNVYGQTALYWACLTGHVDTIAVLVEHQAGVNISDNIGISPLHIACWARNKEAIRLLIEHGADKTLQDMDGKTPVDIVVEENDQECLTLLNQS